MRGRFEGEKGRFTKAGEMDKWCSYAVTKNFLGSRVFCGIPNAEMTDRAMF